MPWAVYGYVGYATSTGGHGVGTVVLGRPLGWLLLQFGAATLVVSALVLIIASLRERRIPYRLGRVRFALMLAGVALFVPWAGWWQLFAR